MRDRDPDEVRDAAMEAREEARRERLRDEGEEGYEARWSAPEGWVY